MPLTLGICGAGAFARCFIPLFKAHPLVKEVVLADLDADKLQRVAQEFGVERALPSLDALCDSEVDAVAVITQNWLHGPQAVQALRAGKHVYSAVPSAITVEEMTALVRAVEETGRLYMVGETSYYYPSAAYCRQRYRQGDFGLVIYAEAEYYHDWDHGLYDVMKARAGDRWREFAGMPPMHYPTHSMSFVTSVTGAYATHVSAQGFVDRHEDGLYLPGANRWGNTFSNESALLRMSDGSICRISEFRRVGHPGTVRMSMHGTQGCFEDSLAGQAWGTKAGRELVSDLLDPRGVTRPDGLHFQGLSAAHDADRLPREFAGLPNGHLGSHQFLVDDFVTACITGEQPPNNVWQAARYLLPGLVAHESALQGGVLLEVPDLGGWP